MFVYYYVHLNRAFAEVERRLLHHMDGLDGWAAAAYRDGEEIRAHIGLGGERPLIAKTVRLEVGTPVRGDTQTSIPIAWEATGTRTWWWRHSVPDSPTSPSVARTARPVGLFGQVRVMVTNWHALAEHSDPRRSVLRRGPESDAAFCKRVLRPLGDKRRVMVINDEALHAWRPPAPSPGPMRDHPGTHVIRVGARNAR